MTSSEFILPFAYIAENDESIITIKRSDKQAKAKEFIKKVYNQYPVNPMNPKQHIMTWGEGDAMDFVIFELDISPFKVDTVEINWISAYPQGAGVGTKALEVLKDLARKDSISLSLYPWDKGRISQSKLTKFYNKRGFNPIMKDRKDLIWNPEIEEAESHTSASKEIRTSLRRAGYKLLGSGADATVWAKKSNSVIKIIMPDDGQGAGVAGDTFMKFYEFCKSHEGYDNLPRFSDNAVEVFEAAGKQYVMITMERLKPITVGSFQEAMVWILSELATRKITWQEALDVISDDKTWIHYADGMDPALILQTLDSLDEKGLLEYEVLFKLMTLLYHKGRINKIGWDLHTENAMMRGDTIVITDPWFNMEVQ